MLTHCKCNFTYSATKPIWVSSSLFAWVVHILEAAVYNNRIAFCQAMLSGGFMESKGGEINLPEIKSAVLEQVIRYMYYKVSSPRVYGKLVAPIFYL